MSDEPKRNRFIYDDQDELEVFSFGELEVQEQEDKSRDSNPAPDLFKNAEPDA